MAIQVAARPKLRKKISRSSQYYTNLLGKLEEQGPIARDYATTSKTNQHSVWAKWQKYISSVDGFIARTDSYLSRYCSRKVKEDPIAYLAHPTAQKYQVFLAWIVHRYPGVKKKSTLEQYWKQLKALYKIHTCKILEKGLMDQVNQV